VNSAGSTSYQEFLAEKTQLAGDGGFDPLWLPGFLFDFQRHLVDWALKKGRAGIFAGCGLGKTPQQLVWGQNVVQKTNRPVLLLTPLAVASQTIREAEKFGVEVRRSAAGDVRPGINVANYERLHHFSASDFAAVICDESGILKNFDGTTRKALTDFMRVAPYRLLCTATPAPNDYYELGTSAEALGYLGFLDMLSRFFINNRNNNSLRRAWASHGGGAPQWRFRGHAERPFWRWVCSWSRVLERPSDLGFDDGPFTLPPLIEREHVVASKPREGMLFPLPAVGLAEERAERRRALRERCEKAADLVDTGEPAVVWCHLNDEGDLLEKLIPGALQVSGRDADEAKEEKFLAFTTGQARVLVTKPIIGAWGLNWQHCAHSVSFAGHSFEQHFQCIRRFWRFGQTRPVLSEYVLSTGEERVLANLQRKAAQAEKMLRALVSNVGEALAIDRDRRFTKETEVPTWL
jgi:hypothetical protein